MAKRLRGSCRRFEIYRSLSKSHIIYAKLLDWGVDCFVTGDLLAIKLSVLEHECESGWCVSESAKMKVRKVDRIGPLTHVPKGELVISFPLVRRDKCRAGTIENDLFSYSEIGGRSYYPEGWYTTNFDILDKTKGFSEYRKVYIYTGVSGKSFLASKVKDIEVYETDVQETLPDAIHANLIVLGNRSGLTIEQVKSKIPDKCEVVVCEFHEPSLINEDKVLPYESEPKPGLVSSVYWESCWECSSSNDESS